MKLFTSTLISWSEPWFFLLRLREARSWRNRFLIGLAASLFMFLTLYFFGWGQERVAEAVGVACAIGFFLTALPDIGRIQRNVTVRDDYIMVTSSIGRLSFQTFKWRNIEAIRLMRPEDWERPFGGMLIETSGEAIPIGVPRKLSMDTLASILSRREVPVTLSGWEPSDSDTRLQTRDEVPIDPERVRGLIEFDPVIAPDGRLMTPAHIALQLVVALGPLLLALFAAVVAAIHLHRHWDELGILQIVLIGGSAVAGVIITFLYLIMIGQFIAASWGISVARSRMRARPNAIFSGQEDDLVTVELFDSEAWTATAAHAADYGFLQIDRRQRMLKFEGNHNRWTVPFTALTTCRIEECLVGSGANPNAEKRYYVVLAADCVDDGEEAEWETGMIYTRTDIGSDSAERRYERAQLLFQQLAEVVQ